MLTRGPSAAGLLLVFLCLVPRTTITNAEFIRTRRATPSYQKQSKVQGTIPSNDNTDAQIYEFLDIHDPRKINNDILALVENESVDRSKNNDEPSLDQQVGQSEIITVDTEDTKDLTNIEHASSVIEYEPQKINKKGKRKIVDTFNNNPDSTLSSSQNSNPASPVVANIYYEVPRNVQPKTIIVTPPYYTIATPEPSKSSEIEAKPRSRDVGYEYPVPTPKPLKSRSSRIRSSFNPQTNPQTDSTKFENAPLYKSYSVQSTVPTLRKQKYYTRTVFTTTPPTDDSYTTRASRRKKNRKRISDKSLPKQELSDPQTNFNKNNNNNNNYPSEFNKPLSSTSTENRHKSRRLGLLAKYDVAPRPFTSGTSSKGSQQGGLEKLIDEGVAASVTRGSNNRNVYSNAVKGNEGETNSYSKIVDPVRASLPGLNRKLYERKDNRESSTSQVNVNTNDPLPIARPKEPYEPESFYSNENNPGPDEKNHRVPDENEYSQDRNLESRGNGEYEIQETPDEGYRRGHSDHRGHNQDDERVTKSDGDGSDDGYNEDRGNGRYAEKYDDGKETDAQSDGSHDNESHQSLTEGAAGGDAMEKGDGGGGGGQGKFEKGEGLEQEEEHHDAEGEKGDKGYKSWHEDEKANKGHHDKERHNNYYDEKDGKEKEHKEESGYNQEHLEDEKGGKQTEFSEKGEHQKGYSTKGQHFVHKKDEFEKRTEFFDEFHEGGDMEKDGEFYHEHEMSKGDNYKVGHHDEDDHEEKYGKQAKYEKGSHYKDNKGHKINEGDDSHYEHEDVHGKKGDYRDEKKWSHKKGDNGDGGEKND